MLTAHRLEQERLPGLSFTLRPEHFQGAPRRHLPDKALDLLDEACAMLSSAQTGIDRPSVTAADIRAVASERSWTAGGTSEEVRDD